MTHDDPLLEPCYDTWRVSEDVGCWIIAVAAELAPEQANARAVDTLERSLAALAGFAKPSKLVIGVPQPDAEWRRWDDTSLARAREFLAAQTSPLHAIQVELDLYVWVRTQPNNELERGWLRTPTELVIDYFASSRTMSSYLRVHHSLFCRLDPALVESNDELHALDSPLLERALRDWERAVGPITEVEGRGLGLYPYGFE